MAVMAVDASVEGWAANASSIKSGEYCTAPAAKRYHCTCWPPRLATHAAALWANGVQQVMNGLPSAIRDDLMQPNAFAA